jgi:ABC-type antimicrobial peptide transport system permease subunit
MIARLTMLFGGLALLLATIGLYGVTAYTVARRTSEIGIRMALGAERRGVIVMMMRGAMLQTLIGLALGVPVALLCVRFVKDLLYEGCQCARKRDPDVGGGYMCSGTDPGAEDGIGGTADGSATRINQRALSRASQKEPPSLRLELFPRHPAISIQVSALQSSNGPPHRRGRQPHGYMSRCAG